jgi:hypothetical protein
MRFYYDTEFLDDGRTIDLISIGIVTEAGDEYYAVNRQLPMGRVLRNPWLVENVLPHLPTRLGSGGVRQLDTGHPDVKPRAVIADEVKAFICPHPDPELWAWYGAYDHVVLAQLWGPMRYLPECVPMFTCDLKQEAERLGNPAIPTQTGGEHNALADARWNRDVAAFLADVEEAAQDRLIAEVLATAGTAP